ncbi:MAG: nucleoside 2-deoxyribosyltransferase [Fidelibacterota bacterium]|nr:MAG: nucleoside 2-deoxyribosyltransferase [Candidatus Neomarinimicrobiota bacterium]
MRIYFSGSISGGREQAHVYPRIIELLNKYGEVLTEFVADQNRTRMGEPTFSPAEVYRRDVKLIDQCDVMVAEVTVPSFGVGVEVARAGFQGKPVLALYQPRDDRRLSAMISGDPNVTVAKYTSIEEAREAVERFFDGMTSDSATP